jgi:probable phosphoglycerate mutase
MTTFALIRHGLTDAVGRTITGRLPGVLLNDTGRKEVEALARELEPVRFDRIISSPLERAQATAAPLAAARRLPMAIDEAFTELEFGRWNGAHYRDLHGEDEWRRFNTIRSLTPVPDGESLLDVQQRAVARMITLARSHPAASSSDDQRIVIVTHGDVVRAVLLYVLGMPIDFILRIEVSPASINIVQFGGDAPRVLQVNGRTWREA